MNSRAGQGGFSTWGDLRDHLIDQLGETPHPATEQDIIDAYELHPAAVEKAAAGVLADVKTGAARSGWGVLRSRANTIRTPVANPTRSSSLDREKRISRAEQWIRSTGCHFDRQSELVDELFGDRGLLEPYGADEHLQARMVTLWEERRPISIQLEQEAIDAADKWKHQQKEHPWNAKQPAAPTHHSSDTSPADSGSASTAATGGSTTDAASPTSADTDPATEEHPWNRSTSQTSEQQPNAPTDPRPSTPTSKPCGNTSAPKPSSRSSTSPKPPATSSTLRTPSPTNTEWAASPTLSPASSNDDLPL